MACSVARGVQPGLIERKRLHDVEHFERGQALAVGRQFVDRPAAIGGGDGIDPFAGVLGKILLRERSAVALRCLHDALRDFAFVVGVAPALGDQAQRVRQIGIAEDLSHHGSAVVRQIRLRRGRHFRAGSRHVACQSPAVHSVTGKPSSAA